MKGDAMKRSAALFSVLFAFSACGTNPLPPFQDPTDPDEIPFACKLEFSKVFEEPFQVTEVPVRSATFSPDCSKLCSIDNAEQRLRVTDLKARKTVVLNRDVERVYFTPDSSRVFFLVPIADTYVYELYVATGETVHFIDAPVQSTVAPSPDGNSLTYQKNPDADGLTSELYLARLDREPPEVVQLSARGAGSVSFTPDGSRIVFQTDPTKNIYEDEDIRCEWYTTTLWTAPTRGGTSQVLADQIMAWTQRVSSDGRRVYVYADYQCETHDQSLVSYPIEGGAPTRLLTGQHLFLDSQGFVELPERGEIVHPMVEWTPDPNDWRSELWATRTDGSGSRVVAENALSILQSRIYFMPLQLAFDDILLYTRRQTYELVAFELDGGSWDVLEGALGQWYQLSPDGRSILSWTAEYDFADLLVTSVVGARSQVVMDGIVRGGTVESWAANGKRVLVVPPAGSAAELRTLYSVDPATGERYIVVDEVTIPMTSAYAFSANPRGWLAAVHTPDGLFVSAVR
jgi:dipeptidyl aminopeptidase/acylaminoacyl peptidase